MNNLMQAPEEAIFFDDEKIYACLASHAITKGHVVIVWKNPAQDLSVLNDQDFSHLMKVVDTVRNTMLEAFSVEKVYLLYMDEVRQVHWHLIPRYDEEGLNVFLHNPVEVTDFSLANTLKALISSMTKNN